MVLSSLCATVVKVKPYLLMVGLQFGSAGMYIISMQTLNQGMSRYVLIVYRNAIAAIFLAPFAILMERKIRPKMTLPTFLQILMLGFLEPVLDQNFAYLGMTYTSASFASAIMNAVPSVTFVMALLFRLEKVNIKEVRGVAKIVGTVVTFGGAMVMTVYKGPIIDLWSRGQDSTGGDSGGSSGKNWALGTLFILIGCCAWSAFYILQSITVKRYPAGLSLASLICLLGAMQSAAVAVVAERHASAWAVGWDSRLLAPVYTGVVSSGITYYVQGIVLKSRGPVFVTAFNPLCMIIVAILGSLILAEKLYLGSVVGGIVIAFGLYSVVWGKGKDYNNNNAIETPDSVLVKERSQKMELPITAGAERQNP